MLATACSATLHGLDARPVRVEVEADSGVPSFQLVGLAAEAVRESRVRVRGALAQLGIELGEYRVVVNLAPADVKKNGGHFDLAIAAATLVAIGRVAASALEDTLFVGELSLSGGVCSARGVLPQLLRARSNGMRRAFVPKANEREAALVDGIDARVVATIVDVYEGLRGERELPVVPRHDELEAFSDLGSVEDLADVRGQPWARKALEVAAAGGHNMLMIGAPGSGKTMLARRLIGILPPLTRQEALEVTALHSVAGVLPTAAEGCLVRERPFRAPHHTASDVALVGGGGDGRPGEVSLAHNGVLFLDELTEFRRATLEVLRQPLEDGVVTVSRAAAKATYPARPLVIAAMNGCPCGYLGVPGRCKCTPGAVARYRGRLSGPMLERIDVQVLVEPVDASSLQSVEPSEPSAVVRERVLRARDIQRRRHACGLVDGPYNGALTAHDLCMVARPNDDARGILVARSTRSGLSARAHAKVLRLARTCADLEGADDIGGPHMAMALQLRALDGPRALMPPPPQRPPDDDGALDEMACAQRDRSPRPPAATRASNAHAHDA